jgi:hypothetical protein
MRLVVRHQQFVAIREECGAYWQRGCGPRVEWGAIRKDSLVLAPHQRAVQGPNNPFANSSTLLSNGHKLLNSSTLLPNGHKLLTSMAIPLLCCPTFLFWCPCLSLFTANSALGHLTPSRWPHIPPLWPHSTHQWPHIPPGLSHTPPIGHHYSPGWPKTPLKVLTAFPDNLILCLGAPHSYLVTKCSTFKAHTPLWGCTTLPVGVSQPASFLFLNFLNPYQVALHSSL